MRGFLQIRRVEAVSTCLQRNSSIAESVSTHAKHNSTASRKNRENHVGPPVPLRAHFAVELATPKTVALASLLNTAPEAPFTRKNTMFRANPNIQIASMMCENEAFVRGFLQFPELEDVTCTTLSCKTQ